LNSAINVNKAGKEFLLLKYCVFKTEKRWTSEQYASFFFKQTVGEGAAEPNGL
jgi:hypothetical protein